MPKKSRRIRNKSSSKLRNACHHGLLLSLRRTVDGDDGDVGCFIKGFRMTFEKDVSDLGKQSVSTIYLNFVGYLEGFFSDVRRGCIGSKDDIESIMNFIIFYAVEHLAKSGFDDNINMRMAQALAMLAQALLNYVVKDKESIQSYVREMMSNDNDLIEFIMSRSHAVRFLMSLTTCSCLAEHESCCHGFNGPITTGDDDLLFRRTYLHALRNELNNFSSETFVGFGKVVMNIFMKFEELGLSKLWDSEEQRNMIIPYLSSLGTDWMKEGGMILEASVIATTIKCLEEFKEERAPFRPSEGILSSRNLNRFDLDLCGDTERKLFKFFTKRNGCSCLKTQYDEMKSGPKKGRCVNCRSETNKSVMLTCSQCGCADYCCKRCQVII